MGRRAILKARSSVALARRAITIDAELPPVAPGAAGAAPVAAAFALDAPLPRNLARIPPAAFLAPRAAFRGEGHLEAEAPQPATSVLPAILLRLIAPEPAAAVAASSIARLWSLAMARRWWGRDRLRDADLVLALFTIRAIRVVVAATLGFISSSIRVAYLSVRALGAVARRRGRRCRRVALVGA